MSDGLKERKKGRGRECRARLEKGKKVDEGCEDWYAMP